MWIVDRYILRQFVQVFLICYLSLAGLFIVFHAFSNLDDFLRAAEAKGGLFLLMADFYVYRLLGFFDRTSGILAMISGMFTLTWIQRHNELTALMAAGTSKGRIARPTIIGAGVLALIAVVNREAVIPIFRAPLAREASNLLGDQAQELRPKYDNRTEILIRGQATFANEGRISEPNFWLPPYLHSWGKEVLADDAYYRPAAGERPSGYVLKGVHQPSGIDDLPTARLPDGEPIILTRSQSDWLSPGECFVVSEMTFSQLAGGPRWRYFASLPELIGGLRNPSLDFGADVRVAIHSRIVRPFLDFTLVFLGLPLVLNRGNRNMFLAIGLCIGVVMLFMLVSTVCQYLGSIYLINAALAAWLPLIVFAPVSAWMAEGFRT